MGAALLAFGVFTHRQFSDVNSAITEILNRLERKMEPQVAVTEFTCPNSTDKHTVRTPRLENEPAATWANRHREAVDALKAAMCGG